MNFKLSLFITLLIVAVTVLATPAPPPPPPPNPPDANGKAQTSSSDGANTSPGNDQLLSDKQVGEKCADLCSHVPPAFMTICKEGCKSNFKKCNKPSCKKETNQ